MSNERAYSSIPKRYFWILTTLFFLFCLRVLGQVLVAFFGVKFLPPMEEWFSGLLPYPELLASQILIILLYGKSCLDFARGYGYFVTPRRRLGLNLLKFGWLYLAVMITRYVIRMALYPHERWTGGSIPIFFHWVLASFLLVLGNYHWQSTAQEPKLDSQHGALAARLLLWSQIAIVGLGVAIWVSYQLAPSLLAHEMGLRRSQFAVRVQKHVIMATTDGTPVPTEIFHPQHSDRTATMLVRIPLSKSLKNSLFTNVVGRMWAERGYTAVVQETRRTDESDRDLYPLYGKRHDGMETLSWISEQKWFNGQIATSEADTFRRHQWAISDE